jgi:hypothetical protein
MKTKQFFLCSHRSYCFGAPGLLVFLALAISLWPQNAAGQHPAVPKLTLAQVQQLVSNGVPDSTLSTQIQRRGLAFVPTPATIESLRAKGAGPLTLQAIQAAPSGAPTEYKPSQAQPGRDWTIDAPIPLRPGISLDELRSDEIWEGGQFGLGSEKDFGRNSAVFSAANSSQLVYGGYISDEGTLELWIKVNHGYRYDNFQFLDNLDEAVIFSSDCVGGDVTWPGTTKLTVKGNGDITLWMATSKYNQAPAQATVATGTLFRFGEWHAIGISYGSDGQWIMLDGKVVAASPFLKQKLGRAGNHQQPLDEATIGETRSHYWDHHRYEGGFDGILAGVRLSKRQKDWALALSPPGTLGASAISPSGESGTTVPDTVPSQRTEESPSPPPRAYKITPILPTSGANPDYTMQVDECHRAGDQILCSGKITNNTDAPTNTYLRDSTAVDDEGNSFFVGSFLGVGIGFPGFGTEERIMPNIPTKFVLTVNDAHRNVKTINLQIAVDWTGGARYGSLIFQGIPVQ